MADSFFTGSDWIVAVSTIGAATAAVVAALIQGKRSNDDDDDHAQIVTFHPDDRSLIGRLFDMLGSARDVMLSLGRRHDALSHDLGRLRQAIEDNTAELRRQRGQ